MEGQRMKIITLAIAAMTALWAGGAMAQSSCTNAIISMSPCLNYISGNSSTPSSSCCSQLASVVRSQPQCLCQVLNGGAASSLGVTINRTLALQLPSACNVQTPSISGCTGAASGPAGSPADIPDSPSTTGSKTDSPSTTGSNTDSPSETTDNNGTSDGFSIKSPFSLLCFLLFSVSYASTFTTI